MLPYYYMDDRRLVEGCIRRDLSAWSAFINKYSALIAISVENSLKKYGLRLRRQDVEDIRQEVLASIWKNRKLEEIRNREDISSWVAVVAGNAAIGYARKLSREPQRPIPLKKMDETELSELIQPLGESAKDEVLRNELSQRIEEAVESLPAKEKVIMKLKIFHDKKYDEISEMLALPKGTVSSYMKRAKDKLRHALKDFK